MNGEPTPAWGSRNDTIWEKYVDITFLVANGVILLTTSFVGIAANVFVMWAVYHQRSLRTWNNALLVNLAVVDALRCSIDCPILFTIVMSVHRRGRVDELVCDAQVASFSFSCCLQLLTLASIGAERYQAIAHPFKTSQRRRRIIIWIPLSWTVAISVAVLSVAFVKDSPVYMACLGARRETVPSYDTFGLYILVPLWTTCFGLIIGFYACIFALVRAHSRKLFDAGSFPLPKTSVMEEASAKDASKVIPCELKDTETGETDQRQTQREPVMLSKEVVQVEPNPPSKDNRPGLRSSTKEPQKNVCDSRDLNKSKFTVQQHKWQTAYMKIAETLPGIERPHPRMVQVKPNLYGINATACQRSSTREPQGILNDSNNMPDNTVKKDERPSGREQPNLQVITVEDERSCLKSSTKESQRILNESNVIGNKSNDTMKVARTHPGVEEPHPPMSQLGPNTSNKGSMAALDSSRKKQQGVLNQSGAVNINSKVTGKIVKAPPMMQVETDSSNKDITDGLKNSTKEPQRKSNDADNLKESKATQKITGLPPGPEQPHVHVLSAPQMDNPKASSVSLANLDQTKGGGTEEAPSAAIEAARAAESAPLPSKEPRATDPIHAEKTDGAVCMMPSLANKETANKRKESKMAKRSGYIVFTFLLFWLPLIANILLNVSGRKTRSSEEVTIQDLQVLSVSVACMTSLSDPIIYAAVNPQFRTEFYRLKRKFKSLWKKT